jgi:thiol-disulfide isomerase/thioredoxin
MSSIKMQPPLALGVSLAAISLLMLSSCAKPPDQATSDLRTNSSSSVSGQPRASEAIPAPGSEASEPVQAGIGAALEIRDGKVLVSKILPETPAGECGEIAPGDQILAVGEGDDEPVDVAGMKLAAIVGTIRGLAGTTVRLTIRPAGKSPADLLVVSLTRGNFKELSRFVDGRLLPVGAAAPDFQFTRLVDGEVARLSQLSGRIVVLEFWFTGCHPCMDALDRMESLPAEHPEWNGQVELVGVSVNDEKEDAVKLFKEKRWPGVSMVWAGPDVAKAYRISGFPTLFVIDQDGKVVAADHRLDIPELVKPLLRSPAS